MSHKILLHSAKNEESINRDQYLPLKLSRQNLSTLPARWQEIINLSELSEQEREACTLYQVYGTVNWVSLLNRIKPDYSTPQDLFAPDFIERSFKKSFRMYLCKPCPTHVRVDKGGTTGWVETDDPAEIGTNSFYIEMAEVVSQVTDCKVYYNSYQQNIYGDQTYGFSFNMPVDVAGMKDVFGNPIKDLFIYFQYIPQTGEALSSQDYVFAGDFNKLLPGSRIAMEKVRWSPEQVFSSQLDAKPLTYTITSRTLNMLDSNGDPINRNIKFTYQPFVQVPLRAYSEQVFSKEVGDDRLNAPDYAHEKDGRLYWKEPLEFGREENGQVVDYPYVNNQHYAFIQHQLVMGADMADPETINFFDSLKGTFAEFGARLDNNALDQC